MSAPKDDTQPDMIWHGVPVAGIAAAVRGFLLVGGVPRHALLRVDAGMGRYSSRQNRWLLLGRSGVYQNFRKVFSDGKSARVRQAVPMAPKRRFVSHVGKTGTSRIHEDRKKTGWLAGLAGGKFSAVGLGAGWGKKSPWLDVGHVLPAPVKFSAGWFPVSKKNEKTGAKQIFIRPSGRVERVRSFAPVGVVTPFRNGGRESSPASPAYQENMRLQTAWRPGLYGRGLAPVGGGLRQNIEVFEHGTGAGPGVAKKDPRAGGGNMSRVMGDYFAHQARLPPSGAMAFDPRLTPAWAGLKFPV